MSATSILNVLPRVQWGKVINNGIVYLLCILLLSGSTIYLANPVERVRAFTRPLEFDYVGWIADAVYLKISQSALRTAHFLSSAERKQLVLDYLALVRQIEEVDRELNRIYADPTITDPYQASQAVRQRLADLRHEESKIAPMVEAILENQLSNVIAQMGLALGGQPLPPVSYHVSPLPSSLIVSPREVIRQDANISLKVGLTTDQKEALEEQVDKSLNVSSLVVGVGGIGVYPTMVMQTTDLNWMSEVVAHEWIHNFLSFRPLGINYATSGELRTMNETAASIGGKELGRALIEGYYPEFLPPPPPQTPPSPAPMVPAEPPPFDFRKEMHQTRLRVDELLAQGRIEEAEAYMEERRVFFWENGYQIRKLNQAYFAFYGAYADEPVGAAGEDPIGAAVRKLRAQSPSLAAFLNRISWMWSPQQLMEAVGE
ncbi:MAG: hypothetical protein DDG59_08750 [Anaerolineae bacterium]|jgi:hypothetical protein|nr:MAG: hypothetical protein DDG59_08750 [Anaerolineae bacterium]